MVFFGMVMLGSKLLCKVNECFAVLLFGLDIFCKELFNCILLVGDKVRYVVR